jgi:methyl-accepting chemotaxis protein
MTGYLLTEKALEQPPDPESAESGKTLRRRMLDGLGAGRRIVVAIALITLFLSGSIGVSIWRYEVALSEASLRGLARAKQLQAQEANTHFWHQAQAANAFLLGDSDAESVVYSEAAAFARLTAKLGSGSAKDLVLSTRAGEANAAFVATFRKLRNEASNGPIAVREIQTSLNARQSAVVTPLEALTQISAVDAVEREAAATSAASQALAVSVITGILALLGAMAFAIFALRVVGRIDRREQHLQDLVAHVRSTSRVLSDVSAGLRAAAQESAAATTEQSAAVAQTSATIEELAATATAIADNTRAVAAAALEVAACRDGH